MANRKHSSRQKEGLFDQAGNVGADSSKFLRDWMDHCIACVKKHAA